MDREAKKRVLRSIPYGLFALGVRDAGGVEHATLVAWMTQLSFEPPMVGVALEREGGTLPLVRSAGAFTITVLPAEARALASRLGRPGETTPDKLAGLPTRSAPLSGAPILDGSGWLDCRVASEVSTGDHVLIVAEVVEAGMQSEGVTLTLAETGWKYAG